jgi:hypothetical protein
MQSGEIFPSYWIPVHHFLDPMCVCVCVCVCVYNLVLQYSIYGSLYLPLNNATSIFSVSVHEKVVG